MIDPLHREIEAALRDVGCSMSGYEIRTWIEAHRPPRRVLWWRVPRLVGYGTLYGALDALVAAGVLRDRWEDAPESPVGRRRLYRLAGGVRVTARQVDRCPACDADALELHHGADGDEAGTWAVVWFECARCGQVVTADRAAGDYVPVVDDEDEP